MKLNFRWLAIKDGGKGLDGTKQYGKNSDLISWNQDGAAAGTITGLSFNDEGTLTAVFTLTDKPRFGSDCSGEIRES